MRTTCRCVLLLCALAATCGAQTSIGFSDPKDLQSLLEYRLPDWGYRTWRGDIVLSGEGDGGPDTESDFRFRIDSEFDLYRESDDRAWWIRAELGSSINRYQIEFHGDSKDRRSLDLATRISLHRYRYYRNSLALLTDLEVGGQYLESDYDWTDLRIVRTGEALARLGVGLGRQRNVTPVLRAKRISERLQAIGRPALSGAEVRRLADVIARQGGYIEIHDRYERAFWGDLLDDLAGDRPFSPAEVFYLRDVMSERIGNRWQGGRLDVGLIHHRESMGSDGYPGSDPPGDLLTRSGAYAAWTWSRNPSLEYQFGCRAEVDVNWHDETSIYDLDGIWGDEDRRSWRTTVRIELSRVVADRLYWATQVLNRYTYVSSKESATSGSDRWHVLRSTLKIYVEDRFTLDPWVEFGYMKTDYPFRTDLSDIEWGFGLRAGYLFDGGMM